MLYCTVVASNLALRVYTQLCRGADVVFLLSALDLKSSVGPSELQEFKSGRLSVWPMHQVCSPNLLCCMS